MKKKIELAYLALFFVGCLLEAYDAGFDSGYAEANADAKGVDGKSGDRE